MSEVWIAAFEHSSKTAGNTDNRPQKGEIADAAVLEQQVLTDSLRVVKVDAQKWHMSYVLYKATCLSVDSVIQA